MRGRRASRRSAPALVGLFALFGLGPLLLLTLLAISLATDAVQEEAESRVQSTAAATAQAVSADLTDLATLVSAYSRRPSLGRAVEEGDARSVVFHLADLKQARVGVATAFLATMDGRLVEIVPATPAIVGQDFSFRDWYRGVTAGADPYVSEAYVTQAAGRERVVAAAAIIRRPDRSPLGILVGAVDLEHIQEFTDRFARSQGVSLTVTDQRGTLVASPGAGATGLVSRRADPRVVAALRGESGVLERDGELSAFVPVEGLDWTVTASVPTAEAFARVSTLRRTVLAIAGGLALVLLLALALLGRTIARRQRAEDEAEAARERLAVQNEELESQHTELEAQQVELEAQQAELERAFDELSAEKERVQVLYDFGRAVSGESRLAELGSTILAAVADLAGSELGALYVLDEEGSHRATATRGLDADDVAPVRSGVGLAGRALAELAPVEAGHGETGLRVPVFGHDVAVGRELHVPLVQAGRAVGVLSLARTADRPFSSTELALLEVLADQASVAIASILAYQQVERLAGVNRAVLDATVDGIVVVGLDGEVVFTNAAVDRLGPDAPGATYRRLEELAPHTADPERTSAFLKRVADDPELEARDELVFSERGVTFTIHTAPVHAEDGELLGRIFTLHDVTAEREAEQLKSELVATVSHELRTPLASILGFSELLVQREIDPVTAERYLATIHAEARRLTALINDFLDLQRIEEGRFTLALGSFDLAELLRHEADLFAGQSAAHEIRVELADETLPVVGDRDRIAQVVANLLSNAIKYSPSGGAITLAAELAAGAVRISVVDRGLGIPADQQPRIFTKFFRVDASDVREIGGTGLGLALAKEIVETHGGRIGFESVEGEGSRFWFELPSAERSGDPGAHRALVVEDDPAAAQLIADYLVQEGFGVTIAATGEEGLARANADPPALVCLDILLPGQLDGWQLLERLKESPKTAHVPVIVCTVDNGRQRATALGAADFLTKPFSAGRLQAAIRRLLPGRGGRILVVDDEPAVRNLVREALAGNGYSFEEAGDGHEALEALESRRPDAVVLDLLMPGLDGFGVLERIQADDELRDLRVVVLTGKHLSAGERARLTDQAVELLEKSVYSSAELSRVVSQALGR